LFWRGKRTGWGEEYARCVKKRGPRDTDNHEKPQADKKRVMAYTSGGNCRKQFSKDGTIGEAVRVNRERVGCLRRLKSMRAFG